MSDNSTRRHQRLVNRIAAMIANQTYNDAPVNYDIAVKAIGMVERSMARVPRQDKP
jgi:hypothetical protein